MKKYVIAISMLIALPVAAQETYENANIVTEELNGTARYVGMGGAMDALGADLSTIASNPAGIGLFRSSQIAATAGLTTQQNAKDFHNASKTHANFDQIGFVWSSQESRNSFLNVAFNYHKSRDFNYILSASQDVLSQQASQNALSYIKAIGDVDADGLHARGADRLDTRLRILDPDAVGVRHAERVGADLEYFRVGL